jgi:hypothetical protein
MIGYGRRLRPEEILGRVDDVILGVRLKHDRKAKLVLVCDRGVVVGEAVVKIGARDPNWGNWREQYGEIRIKPE